MKQIISEIHLARKLPKGAKLKKRVIGNKSKIIAADLAKAGTYKGYRSGTIKLSLQDLQMIIDNFYSRQPNPLPVYLGHADIAYVHSDSVLNEPEAYGWILGLSIEGDTLVGVIELTNFLADRIKEGMYKYTSITTGSPKSKHPVSGEEMGKHLISLAVTNIPFIEGMKELSLNKKEGQEKQHTIYFDKGLEIMSEKLETEEKMTEDLKPEEKMADEMEDDKEVSMQSFEEKMEMLKAMLAEMSDEEKQAVRDLLSEGEEPQEEAEMAASKALSFLTKERDEMALELNKLRKQIESHEKEKAEKLILSAVEKGWILESMKDDYLKLYESNKDLCLSMLDKCKATPAIVMSKVVEDEKPNSDNKAKKFANYSEEQKAFLRGAGILVD